MQLIPYKDGMKPGLGLNLLTGEVVVKSVDGSLTSIPSANGQIVTSKMVKIDEMSALQKALGIDVSASGSYAGFSASAKVDFADSCSFNQYSTYFLIHINVENAFQSMDEPTLVTDAADLLKNNRPERFRERFGDSYIRGIKTGGEYFAIFQISGKDEKEQQEVAVKIQGAYNGIIATAEVAAEIKNKVQSSNSHLEVRSFTFQKGGSDTKQDQNIEQIMQKAHNFPPSVAGSYAVPYLVQVQGYKTLNLPGDGDNLIDIENQTEILQNQWKIRNQLLTLKNDIDYIIFSIVQNRDEFEEENIDKLTEWQKLLVEQINLITDRANDCAQDAKSCNFTSFDISEIKLPKRKVTSLNANNIAVEKLTINANSLVSGAIVQLRKKFPHLSKLGGPLSDQKHTMQFMSEIKNFILKPVINACNGKSTTSLDNAILQVREMIASLGYSKDVFAEALKYMRANHNLTGDSAKIANIYFDYAISLYSSRNKIPVPVGRN